MKDDVERPWHEVDAIIDIVPFVTPPLSFDLAIRLYLGSNEELLHPFGKEECLDTTTFQVILAPTRPPKQIETRSHAVASREHQWAYDPPFR